MLLVLNSFMLRHRSFGTKFYFSMSKSTIFSTYEERNVMKIIFIRHGEPNYEIDSLTEKGWREAELLSKRTAKWNVTDFYCSPLGRAKDTASFTLKNAGREAEILP